MAFFKVPRENTRTQRTSEFYQGFFLPIFTRISENLVSSAFENRGQRRRGKGCELAVGQFLA